LAGTSTPRASVTAIVIKYPDGGAGHKQAFCL
jgi:hypothetical protein